MRKVTTSLGIISVTALTLLTATPALAASVANSGDADALNARVARMEQQLAALSQTQSRDQGMEVGSDWVKKVTLSGGLNVDAKIGSIGTVDNTNNTEHNVGRFSGENAKFMSLNDAYLNMDATVNDWVSARVGLTYADASENYELGTGFSSSDKRQFDVDQAYVTLSNFQQWPYYVRVGRQYLPYGSYDIHPITKSVTQMMTESDLVAVNGGFVGVNGIDASVFVFQNPVSEQGSTAGTSKGRKPFNFGFSVGYADKMDEIGYFVKGGYLYNITALDLFQRDGLVTGVSADNLTYQHRVAGAAFNTGVNYGPFDVAFDLVTSLGTFSNSEYFQYQTGKGAHPTAMNLQGGYKFEMSNLQNRVAVGYGQTSQASALGLPKSRYYADYTVDVLKNVSVGAELSRDVDYGTSYLAPGGTSSTGGSYNVLAVRLGVTF